MHHKKWLLRAFREVNLILALSAMSACGAGNEIWKEEVQLSDGRLIIIERETIHESGGDEWASNRSGTKPKEHRIRLVSPGESKNTIEWRSTKKSPKTWPEIPLFFDVEVGYPVVFSNLSISAACEIYSRYVYKNGIWIEELLPDRFERKITNLLIMDGVGMPKFVNLKDKKLKNSNLSYRLSLRQIGPNREVCN